MLINVHQWASSLSRTKAAFPYFIIDRYLHKSSVQHRTKIFILTFVAVAATSAIDPDKIVYHISVASKDRQNYLQLIIVDRFEYDELSTKLMDSLRQSVLSELFQSE